MKDVHMECFIVAGAQARETLEKLYGGFKEPITNSS